MVFLNVKKCNTIRLFKGYHKRMEDVWEMSLKEAVFLFIV